MHIKGIFAFRHSRWGMHIEIIEGQTQKDQILTRSLT